MALRDTINLIPRNNWEYGFGALVDAVAELSHPAWHAPNLANMFGQNPIWTNAGRTSLYAILKALALPRDSDVGVPLFCCSVVFNAICQAGLQPRFIDSNIEDCNVSVRDLEAKRKDLAAIVPVHMFGNPADMDAINTVAGDIPVIEDCAQSLMATYKGKQTGLLSDISFFSFRCGKYVSAGEGSAIFCSNPELHEKIEQVTDSFARSSTPGMLADSFSTFVKATLYSRPLYGLIGHPIGMRLDKKLNLTAKDGFAAGRIAATHLALINRRIAGFQEKIELQRQHATMLLEALKPGAFTLPSLSPDRVRNWFQFPLTFQSGVHRDLMAAQLLRCGIDTAAYLDGIADEARARYGYRGDCPNAERLSKAILLVPIHYSLHTRDIEHIARSINHASKML